MLIIGSTIRLFCFICSLTDVFCVSTHTNISEWCTSYVFNDKCFGVTTLQERPRSMPNRAIGIRSLTPETLFMFKRSITNVSGPCGVVSTECGRKPLHFIFNINYCRRVKRRRLFIGNDVTIPPNFIAIPLDPNLLESWSAVFRVILCSLFVFVSFCFSLINLHFEFRNNWNIN